VTAESRYFGNGTLSAANALPAVREMRGQVLSLVVEPILSQTTRGTKAMLLELWAFLKANREAVAAVGAAVGALAAGAWAVFKFMAEQRKKPSAPPVTTQAGEHELTGREPEVLRLVAAGWTNQQIADALFITRKTASVHVSNIMAKLGVANRGEAAALAHRLGLVADAPLPVGRD